MKRTAPRCSSDQFPIGPPIGYRTGRSIRRPFGSSLSETFLDHSSVRNRHWIFLPQRIHFLFLLGTPIGLCFSFYVFTIRNKTARFCRHFTAGIIVNLTLIILLVVSYFALREIRELENRPGLVAPAQKPPGETKLK